MKKLQLESQLVHAGAGTGKTTCLVNEVYSLFQQFRKHEERNPRLFVCTFTRKASQELKERLFEKAKEELLEMEKNSIHKKEFNGGNQNSQTEKLKASLFLNYIQSSSLYISTIDGILNLFLRRYGYNLNLDPDFQLNYGQFNSNLFDHLAEEFIFEKNFSLLKKIPYPFLKECFLFYIKCRLKYGKVFFYDEKDFKEFNQEETEKKFSFLGEEFVPIFKKFHQAGEEFFLNFIEEKKKRSLLDIDDLSLFSLSLLRENPQVAQNFSREWDYWFIDEYQDTSWIQEQIIQKITNFKNVFCVGDPAQSIYLFRGADPNVFKRREKALSNKVKKLTTNYRSSTMLISFYNDFFSENKDFIKFKSPEGKSDHLDKPCVYFLTYETSQKSKEQYKRKALLALYYHIQKLIAEGVNYNEIAILSSRNDDLMEIAAYLRSQNCPLMLHSSQNFSQKRLILDSLFLLKFLMNPFDDTNLKALLRTPYFSLSDQELANSSYDHYVLCKEKKVNSFWSFIKEQFSDRDFIKSLNAYLLNNNKQGLTKSFEKALIDLAFMDLSYFQDPTGSFEANLWKFLFLLNKNSLSALDLFYSLTEEREGEEFSKEALSCEDSESIELMTIHKSKGLEFKHVIIMDFSIANSFLKGTRQSSAVIYDELKQKMTFSVPIEGRDRLKIKSYGHEIYNKGKEKEKLLEKDRLFYVAMTRAKQSLSLFVPNSVPEKNSWLKEISFFEKSILSDSKKLLLDKEDKEKITSWKLNEGIYREKEYIFCVKSSESICQFPKKFINSYLKAPPLKKEDHKKEDHKKEDHKKEDHKKEVSVLTGNSSLFGNPLSLKVKSSQDFVNDCLEDSVPNREDFNEDEKEISNKNILILSQKKQNKENKDSIYLPKIKNILFKTHLGNQLHFFLQKLSYQTLGELILFIEKISLSKEDKEKIRKALIYIDQLKDPRMKFFLKTGFAEWPFKIQKKNILLQGQIDLWAWDGQQIQLFDYKSSRNQSSKNKKQLAFYSWILDECYHPEKIWMYELYPFQQKLEKTLYNKTHKQCVDYWLKKKE